MISLAKWKLAAIGAGVLLALIVATGIAIQQRDARIRAEGARDEALKGQRADSVRLAAVVAQRETVYVDRVEVSTRWQTKYDTARVIVTNNIHDTVTVERFIQVADSTVGALRSECAACALLNQSLRLTISNRDSTINILRGMGTPRRSRLGIGLSAGPCAAWTEAGVKPALCVTAGGTLRIWP